MSTRTNTPKDVTKKEDSAEMVIAKNAVRVMAPYIAAFIAGVLRNTELGAPRAYVMSDVMSALGGDRQAIYMLKKRGEASNVFGLLGRGAGKVRAELATPQHDAYKGVTRATAEVGQMEDVI